MTPTNAVDFEGIFESLADAIAVCDDSGRVVAMNRAARAYLAVDQGANVSIELHSRETVRQIRLTDVSSAEFFLADVAVHGAPRQRASASFHPLDGGAYRVLFASGPEGRSVPPNIQMMEALVNVGRHIEMFKSPDKALALFAASFVDVFPTYSFRISLFHGLGSHEHPGWEGAVVESEPPNFVFRGAKGQWQTAIGEVGTLVIERVDEPKFRVSERQAFETFAQQLNLTVGRWSSEPASSDSMLVGPIIDQLDAIVVVCDARRRVLVSNRTFESIVATKELVGRDVLEFFDDPEQATVRTAAAKVMANGEPSQFEAHLKTANRGTVALRVQIAPAHGRDGVESGFVITGQQGELSIVELEARMTRAEQLMNLGELATGVAHELKNPLTSIMNYAEYLLAKYRPEGGVTASFDERDAERLQRIISGVAQIDEFVQDLVTLARPNDGYTAQVNLHSVLHESVMMCEVALAQANTSVKLRLTADQPVIAGVRNQLKQVFVNLIANAGKAMPEEGGTVSISTRLEQGRVLCLIADDGVGMAPETVQRIFEPFFTTRQSRGGSGLGLALVRTIVERHGGEVTVRSELGRGTTFTVLLPVAEGDVE